MAILSELIRALFYAGVPIAATSYLLAWWAVRQGYLGDVSGMQDYEKGIKRLKKLRSQQGKQKNGKKPAVESGPECADSAARPITPVHSKWLAFGGGFYGVVALLTYVVVEAAELYDFFSRFESLSAFLSQLGLGTLITLLLDALINFIIAIAWPVYWLSQIHSQYIWLWLLSAYGAYWLGARLALKTRLPQPELD